MQINASRQAIVVSSPVGNIVLTATLEGLSSLDFIDDATPAVSQPTQPTIHTILTEAAQQLTEYFAASRTEFKLPLAPTGTEFQKKVWRTLQTIPFGITTSYKGIAEQINNQKAVRAVGGANGKNPLPIIIPCHRVVSFSGALGGYSSGLDRKKWLLNHEGISTWN